MDGRLSRRAIDRATDPHDWNSYDHYRTIHEKRLAEHPFVDSSRPNTLNFEFIEIGGVLLLRLTGRGYCKRRAVLEVGKLYETRYTGSRLLIRCILYRYVAWVEHGHTVLRYHNLHANHDEYHHRVFDPKTGEQIFYEALTRFQFPLFSEVLDEMELLTRDLEA